MPPKKDPKKVPVPKAQCGQCVQPNDEEMVQCDECDSWTHYGCADVTKDITMFTFVCHACDPGRKAMLPYVLYSQQKEEAEARKKAQAEESEARRKDQEILRSIEQEQKQLLKNQAVESASQKATLDDLGKSLKEKHAALELKQIELDGKQLELSVKMDKRCNDIIASIESIKVATKPLDETVYEDCRQELEKTNPKIIDQSNPEDSEGESSDEENVSPQDKATPKKEAARKGNEPPEQQQSQKSPQQSPPSRPLSPAHSEISSPRGSVASSSESRIEMYLARQTIPKLPEFHGDRKCWAFFKAAFESSTESGNYNEAENVMRLQEALKGDARARVCDLLMFSKSASSIIEELQIAYGDVATQIVDYTNELIEFRKLDKICDPRLMLFSQKMKEYVAVLKSLKQEASLTSDYVLTVFAGKLGQTSYYREWAKKKIANPTLNIEDFSKFLQQKVKEIPPQFMVHNKDSSGSLRSRDAKKSRVNAHQEVDGQKQASPGSASATIKQKCWNCGDKRHPLFKCYKFEKLNIEERWKVVLSKRLCHCCINTNDHMASDCPRKRVCGIEGCNSLHHSMLHKPQKVRARSPKASSNSEATTSKGSPAAAATSVKDRRAPSFESHSESATNNSTSEGTSSNHHIHAEVSHHASNQIMFKVVPVRLLGVNRNYIDTYAMLDDGSALTLIDKKLHEELGLSGEIEKLTMQWTKGITRSEESMRSTVVLRPPRGGKKHELLNVFSASNLDLPRQNVNVNDLKQRYKYLRGLPLVDLKDAQPQMLIGLRHSKFLCGTKIHKGDVNQPIAYKTELGWIVFGPTAPSFNATPVGMHLPLVVRLNVHHVPAEDEDLHQLVKGFFTTENFGVAPPSRALVSSEDERSLSIMKKTLKFKDSRYEIGLLWKRDDITLPNSLPMAMKRLVCTERSLKKKPDLLLWKNQHVRDLLQKGYAHVATKEELERPWQRVWYTPTFVTINQNKVPPKPRDVADVAAKVDGISLNSNLLKGPDNLAPLLAGLFRMREGRTAVNADVKEMFHQIGISEADRQCQRFLWRDGDDSKDPTVYIMDRMMFGPTCSPSCAQFVKNYHADLHKDEFPEAAEALVKTTYVDDYLNSHNSIEKAFKVTSDAIRICATMGFDLVGVQSNSTDLLKLLPERNIKAGMVNLDFSDATDLSDASDYVTKVLGMYWRPMLDIFTFVFCENESTKRLANDEYVPTKREILSTLMRTFDCLGLIAHYLIRGKIILQEIWREGVAWDDEVPHYLKIKWMDFVAQLKNIEKLELPRFYAPNMPDDTTVQMIVFVDASEEAFATIAYFIFRSKTGVVDIAQVMAKAKVAPIKQLSIPQLELQAAVLGVRLSETIKQHHTLKIESAKFLSDSRVVLSWIHSKTYKFKPFVAVRVGEILDTTTRIEWWHVPTLENVADDATRSTPLEFGDSNTRWFRGPEFLKRSEEEWPIKRYRIEENDEETQQAFMMMVQHEERQQVDEFDLFKILKPKFTSRWSILIRATVFLLRARDKFKKVSTRCETYATVPEMRRAELFWFKIIQQQAFAKEIRALLTGGAVDGNSSIIKLCPFIDPDGVLRMNTRSNLSNASFAAKKPAILPNKHQIVDMFVQHHHEANQHMAEETTIADLRRSAWIINIRVAYRRVKSSCQICKNKNVKPIAPLMGQLPLERVDFGVKPFTYVGVDCFGPLYAKLGRATVKRYGIIFTCLTYRAIHLELLFDMSLNQVMMAIRSLFARRGKCKSFYSDNGTNFIGAKNEFGRDVEITADLLGRTVATKLEFEWKFIPAYSPWMGGAWERMIGIVKKCIDFTLNGETPREDVLRSALTEAEFQINRRPLTHAPIDHEDAKPLTPNMVLFGDDEDVAQVPGEFVEADNFSKSPHRRAQHLAKKFMHRFLNEFLPEITRRGKWFKVTKPIEVDDIVIIIDPNETKFDWLRGRVVKVHPGPDGIARSADVMLKDRTIKTRRSVGRLAVLDLKKSPSSD